MCSHLTDERQDIAPTQDLMISDSYEVAVPARDDIAVVLERLLSGASFGESHESPLSADRIEKKMQALEVSFLKCLKMERHGFVMPNAVVSGAAGIQSTES